MSCGRRNWTAAELAAFERRIADRFLAKEIHAPIHLSGGNEEQLINIFKEIQPEDWVLSTHRNHYHALLHGISPDWVEAEILAGRSMHLNSPSHWFLTSAIVGGMAPIAVGIAMGLKRDSRSERVWCFVGDMAAKMGIVAESIQYAFRQGIPVTFCIEDNFLSAETSTDEVWGQFRPSPNHLSGFHFYHRDQDKPIMLCETPDALGYSPTRIFYYPYKRQWPHVGVGQWVTF